MDELKYVMEGLQPEILVVRKDKIFDKKEEDANAYISRFIKDHYKLHASIDNAIIYERSNPR